MKFDMMAGEESLLAVVDHIYESIESPEHWPETIQAIGALVGGRHDFWHTDGTDDARVSPRPREGGCRGTLLLSRADLRDLDQYAEEFGELITKFLKIVFLSTLWSRKNVDAREAIGRRMVQRYLNAFRPPLSQNSSLSSSKAARNLIAALWEEGQIFSSANLRAMRLLAPHLDRALRLGMRLKSSDLRADIMSGALDCLTVGAILVDHSGLPLWHNRRAQEILGESNNLQLSSAGLKGCRPSETQSLRELIKEALSAGTQGVLAVDRGTVSSRPLLLIAMPLKPVDASHITNDSDQFACGVVFISDPDRDDNLPIKSLQQAFDLTYREAQTAIAIARGHGLKAAAKTMGVAPTTARSQLQQAFEKTGTSHQAELAALVHRTLTHLRYN